MLQGKEKNVLKSKYIIKKVNLTLAKTFWENSSQATFFTNPDMTKKFENNVDWWIISKGEEDICMWSICCTKEKKVYLPLFAYYFGPIWSDTFLKIADHSKLNSYLKTYELFFEKFTKIYKKFQFQTHYENLDLRFFIWWNQNNKTNFKIKPKYSSVLKNIDNKNDEEILLGFRELRRRMVKKAQKNKEIVVTYNCKFNEISQLYTQTLKNKKQKISKQILSRIKIFNNLCKTDSGKIIGFRNRKNNKLVSVILLTFAKNSANLVLNLSDNLWKKTGVTALNMLESIKFSKKLGKSIFDFNGANSLVGSDDKHSYGSQYRLYFELELIKKSK